MPRLGKTIYLPVSQEEYRIVEGAQYLQPDEAGAIWSQKLPSVHFAGWRSLPPQAARVDRTLIVEPVDLASLPGSSGAASPSASRNGAAGNPGAPGGAALLPGRQAHLAMAGAGARLHSAYRLYDPFTVAGGALFRAFAELAPTPDGVLGFANRYGLLFADSGRSPSQCRYVFVADGVPQASLHQAEDVADWYAEIEVLRTCLDLWDPVQAGDDAALLELVRVSEVRHGGVMYTPRSGRVRRLLSHDHPVRPYFEAGQFRAGVLLYLQGIINERLAASVSPTLEWGQESRLELTYVPNSLLSAIWLQFGLAVDENRSYRRCAECGKWFESSPGVSRKHRVYCTDACRARAHRRRVETDGKQN